MLPTFGKYVSSSHVLLKQSVSLTGLLPPNVRRFDLRRAKFTKSGNIMDDGKDAIKEEAEDCSSPQSKTTIAEDETFRACEACKKSKSSKSHDEINPTYYISKYAGGSKCEVKSETRIGLNKAYHDPHYRVFNDLEIAKSVATLNENAFTVCDAYRMKMHTQNIEREAGNYGTGNGNSGNHGNNNNNENGKGNGKGMGKLSTGKFYKNGRTNGKSAMNAKTNTKCPDTEYFKRCTRPSGCKKGKKETPNTKATEDKELNYEEVKAARASKQNSLQTFCIPNTMTDEFGRVWFRAVAPNIDMSTLEEQRVGAEDCQTKCTFRAVTPREKTNNINNNNNNTIDINKISRTFKAKEPHQITESLDDDTPEEQRKTCPRCFRFSPNPNGKHENDADVAQRNQVLSRWCSPGNFRAVPPATKCKEAKAEVQQLESGCESPVNGEQQDPRELTARICICINDENFKAVAATKVTNFNNIVGDEPVLDEKQTSAATRKLHVSAAEKDRRFQSFHNKKYPWYL